MFDLLASLIEGIIDAVGDLFSDGADAVSGVVDGQTALPAVTTDAWGGIDAASIDPGGSSADSWLAATDGGIAPDRFDPRPVPGPFTP